jgi:hypothetical protein
MGARQNAAASYATTPTKSKAATANAHRHDPVVKRATTLTNGANIAALEALVPCGLPM